MGAPARRLLTAHGPLQLGGRPQIMGVLNCTPDSFSDLRSDRGAESLLREARAMIAAGAAIIDVGGESAVTNRPAIGVQEEIARVLPLVEGLAALGTVKVSIDTYKPEVAAAAIAAGAAIVNDVSGLRDPELADVCAATGAALVLMHTRAAPKQKLLDPALDGQVLGDVMGFLRERIDLALGRGLLFEQLMLDPGPDFSKTPSQTVEVLRDLRELHSLECPLLLAVSRKDFVGALTHRAPRRRLAGTLAAIAHGVREGAHVLRVHDVAETAEFLTVVRALTGEDVVDPGLRLADELRWER